MAQEIVIAPVGLFTDPNPLSAAPPGAMSEALNVVIARPGVVEPRPGLTNTSSLAAVTPAGYDIVRMIPFEDDILLLLKSASTGAGHAGWYVAADDITQTGDLANGTAWGLTVGQIHGAATKGNLYVTCTEGVFRAIAPGDDTAERAGLTRPGHGSVAYYVTGGTNYPLVANTATAYRMCGIKAAGKITIRSAPSGRTVQRSYTGSAAKATLVSRPTTDGYDEQDSTEVYRSMSFTTSYTDQPSDEMVCIGSTDTYDFSDDVGTTGLLGASLYTNATQSGALLENGITPLCRDVATFRDMVFFGAAQWAPRLTFEVLGFGPDWNGLNASTADRVTYFTVTGTIAVGSNNVTGVAAADTARIRVGMRVYDGTSGTIVADDAYFPVDTYVATVGATSFTTTKNALSAGVVALEVTDWFDVSVYDGATTTTVRGFTSSKSTTSATQFASLAHSFLGTTTTNGRGPQHFAYQATTVLGTALGTSPVIVTAMGDGETSVWTLLVEAYRYDVESVTVKCSNPAATPNRIDSTTGISAERSGSVATLAWSKPGEPEHVPPGYNTEIGAYDKAIERIIPARDALYVFKEDGVWRVSGYSPDTLQVDEYDRTMRLVHPDAACEWDGRVAAWTNKGVMLIGDGGAQEISLPIANLVQDATDIHAGNAAQGVFLTGWLDRGLLLLGIPASTSTGYAEYIYCWSQRTGAWTRWNHDQPITCAAAVGDYIYFGTKAASGAAIPYIVTNSDGTPTYDASYSVTISAVTGTTITINAGSGWTPAVGDILTRSGTKYAVTAFASATSFTVHQTGATTGAATAYARPESVLTWTVRDADNPGAQKQFREATMLFGSANGVVSVESDYTTDRSQTTASADAFPTYTETDVPTTVRTRIPREARRCGRLEHQLTITGAYSDWTLHGASYVYEPLSTRVGNG